MDKYRRQELENLAVEILRKYNIVDDAPGKHLDKIIKGENIKLIPEYDWPFEYCGRFIRDEDEFTIIYNANHSKEMQAFTFAHELGHYYLHHFDDSKEENICLSRDLGRLDDDDENKPKEVEANYFAACLLLPLSWVNHFFNKFMDSINLSGRLYVDTQECNLEAYKQCIDYFKMYFFATETAIRYRLICLGLMVFDLEYVPQKSKRLYSISELVEKQLIDLAKRTEEYYKNN